MVPEFAEADLLISHGRSSCSAQAYLFGPAPRRLSVFPSRGSAANCVVARHDRLQERTMVGPRQSPLQARAAARTSYCIGHRNTSARFRLNGEDEGFPTPGAAHPVAWTSAVPWIGQACHSGAMALSLKSWRRHALWRPGSIQEEIFNLLNARTPSGPSAAGSQPSR